MAVSLFVSQSLKKHGMTFASIVNEYGGYIHWSVI